MKTTENSIIQKLRAKGHKMTHARKAIVEILLRSKAPVSAADVHSLLQKQKVEASNVTVYRELAFLEVEGFLHSDKFKDGVKRYCQASVGHHHHLVCTECNTVQDVEMENDLDSIEKKIHKEKSFKVKSHSLEFYGLCAQCA
jgi:Fur family ferric uptake transcriptional regulator